MCCLLVSFYYGYCEPITRIHCEFLILKASDRHDYVCDVKGLNINTKSHSILDVSKINHFNGNTDGDVTAVHFHNQRMKYIPGGLQEIFPNMTTINIRNSTLTFISKDDFKGFRNTFGIVISASLVERLPEDTFNGLTTLKRLELSSSKIKMLYDKTFHDLVELKNLILCGNEIEEITPFLFAKNTKLLELNLINNHIKFIDATAFDTLNNIETIWMTGNVCIDENVAKRFELDTFVSKITEKCKDPGDKIKVSLNTELNKLKSNRKMRHCNTVVYQLHMKHMQEIESLELQLVQQNEDKQELLELNNKLKEIILNVTESSTAQKQNKVFSKFSYRFIVVLLTFLALIILSNFIYQKCFKVHYPDGSFEPFEHSKQQQQ